MIEKEKWAKICRSINTDLKTIGNHTFIRRNRFQRLRWIRRDVKALYRSKPL